MNFSTWPRPLRAEHLPELEKQIRESESKIVLDLEEPPLSRQRWPSLSPVRTQPWLPYPSIMISCNLKECMSGVLSQAQESFERSLAKITLADLVGQIREKTH